MSSPRTELPHPELHRLRTQLREMLESMSKFVPAMPKPPIIDSSFNLSGHAGEDVQRRDAIRGMRSLKDTVKRDLDVLEKFLAKPECARLPALSTNAPYLISVWKEVLCAPEPVTAISNTYSENGRALHPRKRGLPREAGVKVDVVADGGRRWIRVNTTKNSRMLAEFREIDSYLTDSEDESCDEGQPPGLAQTEFDNSILRMGRALLSAAKENPIPGSNEIPAVTLRLTRLDPNPEDRREHDPRISQTIGALRAMGIDVRLGERDDGLLSNPPDDPARHTRPFHPTRQINLDLSTLIALVSDLTHAPLPASPADAEARFTPSTEYVEWKKKRLTTMRGGAAPPAEGDTAQFDVDYVGRPSRALVTQVLQEMGKGLLVDISERLGAIATRICEPLLGSSGVEFWTTPEAKQRCLEIVGKIGGPLERRRTLALFSDDPSSAEDAYWAGSRFPGGFVHLLPVRLLPCGLPDTDAVQPISPFFSALARTCRSILSLETIPNSVLPPADGHLVLDESDEIPRAVVTRANPRLTAHTVQSLLWGAARGWTTLTANKTSIKAILKEMKSARNGILWDRSDVAGEGGDGGRGSVGHETAAIWMVDPRSLAEGMRADFGTP
ncbi:hypothetical protein PHLGIDRAFT_212975 [Phlebiopsis gigantea 11061_1 CR5-6]|uniref:DUF1308 domain-containing protein n=1 Tax=Phlebiopsis gigantea (strain 11061_1 CR5-6) TaxID=745531 RepID=A0A0C3S2V8_PHLG1|nr:hypothetical protein PHLGIDRAFT_212975 [Phlebiopsis gigantea 11061_1 CR5-6]